MTFKENFMLPVELPAAVRAGVRWPPISSLAGLSLLVLLGVLRVSAAAPEQFRIWGTAGPGFANAPAGWREEIAPMPALPPLIPTATEQHRGCVVFARDPLGQVDSTSTPTPDERTVELFAFLTPGAYEPVALAAHALEDLRNVRVSGEELRTTEGATIPVDHIDVRLARALRVPVNPAAKTFRWRPFLLERRESFTLDKGTTALIWITVKAPEAATPGAYRGAIRVQPEGKPPTVVALQLRVLPFRLPSAPVEMGLYYPRPPASDRRLNQELIDLREHGLAPPIPAMEVRIESRDRVFGADDLAATRTQCERLLRAERNVFGPWRFPLTFEAGHQITHYWEPAKNWFVYWPHQPAMEADLAKALGAVIDVAGAQGASALRAYLIDEGGAHNLLDEAVYYNRLVKQRFPRLDTCTTIGGGIALGQDEIGQLSGTVDFLCANRFTPEIARALSARKRPFGVYNGAGPTPAGVRFFFGFHGWKSGASQIAQWAYGFGDALFRGNGLRQEDDGYVYTADDGPLPSLMGEAVREGVDDYRYLYLLWRMIGAAKNLKEAGARQAASQAEQAFTNILGQIGWGFMAAQSGDRTAPPNPSTLRKWRWQVAQQILALLKFTPAVVAGPDQARPGPLDLPWRETVAEPVQFGPEILPPSDFESGLKPWRVEAWNGQGQGQLVSDEKHAGRQSVRIVVPTASGNAAVTVLVWPQYGDGKLNLSLEGGRTYEFAAWVKLKDRSVPPELRVNVLSSVIGSSRTGQGDPAPDGWRRLWIRVEMKAPAPPTYLALWVQGPGTVWMDDLSLREVIPPPLTMTLDQDEYDAADKVAVGSLTVARQVHPLHFRVSLISGERGVVEELALPFASEMMKPSNSGGLSLLAPADLSRCRFIFNPAALAPGSYACQAVLLDANQHELAIRTISFQRIPDVK